jgi:tetratricopeptide (TPR) repeat protein
MIGAIRGARDQNQEYMTLAQHAAAGSNLDATAYIKLAQMYEGRGNGAGAQGIYDYLLSKESRVTNKEVFGYLLKVFGDRKDAGRAVRTFERITEVDPADWQAWLELSKFKFTMGSVSDSFACIDTALKIDHEKARVRLLQDEQFQMMRASPDMTVKKRFEDYIK